MASLDHDRILRSFLTLIQATVRTNCFQRGEDGGPKPYLSFKLDPRAVPDLPAPRPVYEIFVYSPRVEGVHLRFGDVARGGLRWSDRQEDFRTEVLGLVKAQTVKNAVIVPTGAKGGFVGKQLPTRRSDREAWLAEGVECYKTFIRGLLDVTDNLVDGGGDEVEPPPRVVRHDGDDPYLVVAADKGTASFSDIANGVAAEYGFWLGDAFASGGSVGYDHKAMGITARGAWESVKRHFRELGHDIQTEDFTVVGIGDMSGDVFGNGMLLSRAHPAGRGVRPPARLPRPRPRPRDVLRRARAAVPAAALVVGRLRHRPDLAGRRACTRAPRSPSRSRRRCGRRSALPASVAAMTPAELITAILKAPVDLLWNGGIGTYVKASERVQRRGRRQGQRRDPGRRRAAARQGRRRGRQPRPHPARPRGGRAGRRPGQHRRHRQLRRRRRLRPRGQHQDPARPASSRPGDLTSKQRNELLAEMTDEVGRAGAARQLRAERRCSATPASSRWP